MKLNKGSRPIFFAGLFILAMLCACDRNNPDSAKTNAQTLNKDDIKGIWYLNQWTAYHTLIFSDSTIHVDNHVDTVFTVDYTLEDDTLIVQEGANIFKNKVIHLTKDTLIVDGIGSISEKRSYSRKKQSH